MLYTYIRYCFILGVTASIVYIGYYFNTGNLYGEYARLYEYRRLHPDFLPNPKLIQISSAGHVTTYADTLWIQLIQYLGDNVGSGKHKNFLNPLIEVINILHPNFGSPYNIALVLSPILNPENPNYESQKQYSLNALKIGEKGIERLCDKDKIEYIKKEEFGFKLWDNPDLKNPCLDDMIAYNSAYIAQEVSERGKAAYYYKIASMNTEAPQASRFLGPLMLAKDGAYKEVAKKFLLIAIEGYDEEPYFCRKNSLEILKAFESGESLSILIEKLAKIEDSLPEIQDKKNPLANGSSNCHDSLIRAMKQIYLTYIDQISSTYPDIQDAKDLIKKGVIRKIPTIKEQNGWDLIRDSNGIWKYRRPL